MAWPELVSGLDRFATKMVADFCTSKLSPPRESVCTGILLVDFFFVAMVSFPPLIKDSDKELRERLAFHGWSVGEYWLAHTPETSFKVLIC
jgi:hypothetical protein